MRDIATLLRRPLALAAAVALVPGTAAAQVGAAKQLELGAYGIFTRFDPTNVGLNQNGGAGARLGWFLSRSLTIEATGDFTPSAITASKRPVKVARVGGDLLLNMHLGGDHAVYVGAGYQRTSYREGIIGNEDVVNGILGDRLPLGGRTAFRLEGRVAYLPNANLVSGSTHALNFTVSAGLSIFSFGGPQRDADKDGVSDKHDRCANTPTGALVDATGCPGDDDHDGVLNGLDRCVGTPSGALVDPLGCPTDTDKDGVLDGLDLCADTPIGATVDTNGCPTDTDKDGVLDGLDQCADTPAGATVDVHGCPTDSDGDKIFDGLDQCPNTPPNTEVDAKGCTVVKDSDKDGVDDPRDRCPNTAVGVQVDAVGCPLIFQVQEAKRRPVILKGVSFESGRSALTTSSYATLDDVAASLQANPTVRVEIAGHTDATGSRQRNTELSLARALAVKAYLTQKGVSPDRMVAKGYGPDRPLAPNTTAAGRAQNRRVELSIIE